MLTTSEMCKAMGVCTKTLYTWRLLGCPFGFDLRRQTYMYDLNMVREWLEERKKEIKGV